MLKIEKDKYEKSDQYKKKKEMEFMKEFHNNNSNYSDKIFNKDRNIIAVQGKGSFG